MHTLSWHRFIFCFSASFPGTQLNPVVSMHQPNSCIKKETILQKKKKPNKKQNKTKTHEWTLSLDI